MFTIDRDRIARHGLNISDIQDVIEIAVDGTLVSTRHGYNVLLHQLAGITVVEGPVIMPGLCVVGEHSVTCGTTSAVALALLCWDLAGFQRDDAPMLSCA